MTVHVDWEALGDSGPSELAVPAARYEELLSRFRGAQIDRSPTPCADVGTVVIVLKDGRQHELVWYSGGNNALNYACDGVRYLGRDRPGMWDGDAELQGLIKRILVSSRAESSGTP